MYGGISALKAMEKLNDIREEYYSGLEDSLEGKEKIEYESLKSEVVEKNKRTWRKSKLVGGVGMFVISSALLPFIMGLANPKESRRYFNYCWGAIIGGNLICAASYGIGQARMAKRSKELTNYLESHTKML